jgi:hypothetical protein
MGWSAIKEEEEEEEVGIIREIQLAANTKPIRMFHILYYKETSSYKLRITRTDG